jgi:hypothetical protein
MAQHDFVINNQGFPAFRSDLNDFLNAVRTSHSGTSLPSGAVAGTIWLDTTNAGVPLLKYYDGTDNITLATINHATNTVDFNDSTISTPLAVTGNATAGAEIRLPEDTDNGSNYVALKAPDTIASNLTFTLPSADGTNGQVLSTNGSQVLSFITPSAGIAFQSSVKTSGFTAVAGEGYFCNTTSSAFTVTLPATPTAGQQVAVVDYAGTFDTNALTINPNSNKIEGQLSNVIISGEREGVILTYIDATQGWLSISAVNEGTKILNLPYSIDFLVVGGGGSGGSRIGGGGGAGGFRTSTQSVGSGTVITVTVGDGGALVTSMNGVVGNNGTASSISGSGLTTISSAGGGGGGALVGNNSIGNTDTAGNNGGSGGGGGFQAGGGSGNTPSTSPSQGNNGGSSPASGRGGGGGGAGGVGSNSTTSVGGNGGAGSASSITGSSVTYAGGGGGSGDSSGGTGGAGGGGAGTTNTDNGGAGTANTGGGGGGARNNTDTSNVNSGAGGKGVVILSFPTANYSGTSTGSPTLTTSGSNTILTFTGTGSYTA